MSWIHTVLNLLFPPPVPVSAFRSLPPARPHDHCQWILTATQYRHDAKKIVRYIKETPDAVYYKPCAQRMAAALESYLLEMVGLHTSAIALVPVPQHASRTQQRGFSQSQLLAKHIASFLPYTTVENILKKVSKTEKQALLPRAKRLVNQKDSFAYAPSAALVTQQTLIVIIDDVSTTGSTLLECKTALDKHGFKNVIGLVFAH